MVDNGFAYLSCFDYMNLQPCVRLFKELIFKTTVGISPQGYSEKQIKKKKTRKKEEK